MDRLLPGVLAVVGHFEQTLGARDATLPLIRLGPALVLMGLMLCAPGEMAGFAMMALAVDMLVMVLHGQATPMAMMLHGLCMVGMTLATAWGLRRRMGPLPNRTVTLRNLLDLTTGGAVMALPLALADAALTHGRHGVPTANLLFGHIGPIMLGVVTLLPLVLMGRREEEQDQYHAPAALRALLYPFPAMLVSASLVWPTPVLAVLMPVAMVAVTLELTLREAMLSIMLTAGAATGMTALADPGLGHGIVPIPGPDALDAIRARWLSWMMGTITLSVAVHALRRRARLAESLQDQTMVMLNAIPEAAFRADMAGHWTWLSPGWTAMGGSAPIGRPMIEAFAQNQRDRLSAAIARQGKDGPIPATLRLTLDTAPQSTREVDLSLTAMPGGRGIAGIIRDITHDSEALRAARHAEASWHELCDAAPVAIMRCDPNGIVTYANWAAELTALGAQMPLLGHPLRNWLGDDPAFDMAALEAALTMPGAQIMHERETGTAERRKWLSVTVTAKFDPAGRRLGYVVAAGDITARKRLEDELIEARHHADSAAISARSGRAARPCR